MEASKKPIGNSLRPHSYLGTLALALLGILLLWFSELKSDSIDDQKISNLLSTVGSTILISGLVSFIYEVSVRRKTIDFIKHEIQEVFRKEKEDFSLIFKDALSQSVKKEIEELTSVSFTNLHESGIKDAYYGIYYQKLREKLDSFVDAEVSEFRVLKISSPNLPRLSLTLEKILKIKTKAKIALLHPDCTEAIKRRAESLNLQPNQVKSEIIFNLRSLKEVWDNLPEEKRGNLDVRLYSSFISLAMYGYGETYIVGFHLSEKFSEEGYNLKVMGCTTPFYKHLDRHFYRVWDGKDTIKVDFSDKNQFKKLTTIEYCTSNDNLP